MPPARTSAGGASAGLLLDHGQQCLLVRRAQELRRLGVEVGEGDGQQLALASVLRRRLRGQLPAARHPALAQADEAGAGFDVVAEGQHGLCIMPVSDTHVYRSDVVATSTQARRRRLAVAGLVLAIGAVLADSSVVVLALPDILSSFNTSVSNVA